MVRLSNPAPAANLSVSDRLGRYEAIMADMLLVLEEMERRVAQVGENVRTRPTQIESKATPESAKPARSRAQGPPRP